MPCDGSWEWAGRDPIYFNDFFVLFSVLNYFFSVWIQLGLGVNWQVQSQVRVQVTSGTDCFTAGAHFIVYDLRQTEKQSWHDDDHADAKDKHTDVLSTHQSAITAKPHLPWKGLPFFVRHHDKQLRDLFRNNYSFYAVTFFLYRKVELRSVRVAISEHWNTENEFTTASCSMGQTRTLFFRSRASTWRKLVCRTNPESCSSKAVG